MNMPVRNQRLRDIIEDRGIQTAAEFARLAGLKESTARAYLLGTRSPPLDVCLRIGQALGISGEWIYYGKGAKDAARTSIALTPSPSELIFAAVEEMLLLAGFSAQDALDIAAEIQLVVDARVRTPPGMTPQDAIRRLVRMQLAEILPTLSRLPPKDPKSP